LNQALLSPFRRPPVPENPRNIDRYQGGAAGVGRSFHRANTGAATLWEGPIVQEATLQVGGFLGIGAHLVAVPYESLIIDDEGSKIQLPGASKDELKKLPELKYRS
jgi:hypothetical protein